MVIELIRDGSARRYRAPGDEQVVRVEYREPYELWDRTPPDGWAVPRKLLQVVEPGTAAEVDLDALIDDAGDFASRCDLLEEVAHLHPGEATEVFYVASDGKTMGRRTFARVG